MDTVWTVVGIIVGAMYGAGLVVVDSPVHCRFAQVLFWGSGALIGAWCFAWELMTEASTPIRVIVGLVTGAFVFVIVPETARRMIGTERPKSDSTAEPTNQIGNIHGNKGIVTQEQNGDNQIISK
jgi:hypothetical protein